MKNFLIIFAAALALAGCGSAPNDTQAPETTIRASLSDLGKITSVQPSEWPGVYQVEVDGHLLYASADGKHFITGDLYRAPGEVDQTPVNLSELKRADLRKKVLANLNPGDAIVFAPKGATKHKVWVFTDVNCPYCQRFHHQIADYNKLGIEVHYLAYPRAGQGSQDWNIMHEVWCAKDKKAAMTQAKNGQAVPVTPSCSSDAVARDYAAGQAAGLRGTPMIIDASGRTLGGYLSPGQLIQRLQTKS